MPILMLLMGMAMAVIIVVLALQNGRVVTVSFFDWAVEASLVLVIMVSAFMGFLTALFLELYIQLKLRYKLFRMGHQVKQLEEELERIKKPIIATAYQPGDGQGVGP